MKVAYIAEDGRQFDTEQECREYESKTFLSGLISSKIGCTYNDDAGFSIIEVSDVEVFILSHIDDIIRIVKGEDTTQSHQHPATTEYIYQRILGDNANWR